MNREAEHFYAMFTQYLLDKKLDPHTLSDSELDRYIKKFTKEYNAQLAKRQAAREKNAESIYDYLELIHEAETPEEALHYAKKVQKLDKDNLEAAMVIAEITSESKDELAAKYRKLIKKAEKQLAEMDLWNENCFGEYWTIFETRPYMKLRYGYAELLVDQGKRRKAIEEYQDMLRLCETDNMGVRYRLMHLYAFYENELAALRLYKQYDGDQETMMLLPLILLYYRLDDYPHAKKYLKQLYKVNPEANRFFFELTEEEIMETIDAVIEDGQYAYGSAEELLAAMVENPYLYNTTDGFTDWVLDALTELKK